MTEAADTLVFLYNTKKDKEAELSTLEAQRKYHAEIESDLIRKYHAVQLELDALNAVLPMIKKLNDDGR